MNNRQGNQSVCVCVEAKILGHTFVKIMSTLSMSVCVCVPQTGPSYRRRRRVCTQSHRTHTRTHSPFARRCSVRCASVRVRAASRCTRLHPAGHTIRAVSAQHINTHPDGRTGRTARTGRERTPSISAPGAPQKDFTNDFRVMRAPNVRACVQCALLVL